MVKKYKLYDSKEWIIKRYVTEKKTVLEMAMEAKCSHMTIQRELQRYGLIKSPRKGKK
jgi:IS30 family transposase